MADLLRDIAACRLCADRFAATATAHAPRRCRGSAPLPDPCRPGRPPACACTEAGRPFADPSGDRLRNWMAVDEATFYDRDRIAIVPMAFCFPGYDARGADLPPPPICARTWRDRVMEALPGIRLTIVIGAYAQKWHLGGKQSVTQRVQQWSAHAPDVFPLPHPSWRNTAWLKRNPWFAEELLPALRRRVAEELDA